MPKSATRLLASVILSALSATTIAASFAASPGASTDVDSTVGSAADVTGHRILTSTLVELAGESTAAQVESVLSPHETIDWQMYVPPTYDREAPAGLLVYVSPTQSGEIPRGWVEVLDRHNIIWIAANRSGNDELVARRILLALLAPTAAKKHYAIDAERIYISGLSGGGKTASMIATDQAQLFRGAIYNCGVEVWDAEEPLRLEQMRQNRYVFVTGTYDQALEPTKRAYRAYRKAGVENSKLMVIRHMTHRNPDSYEFEEALQYLDARN